MGEKTLLPVTRDEVDAITDIIIGCGFRVSNGLGVGFLEKVYENALFYELQKCGLKVHQQEYTPRSLPHTEQRG